MKRKFLFISIITFIISLIIIIITLVKDNTSMIGYGLFITFFASTVILFLLYYFNDSISKYRKIELENFIKNHPELEICNVSINNSNAYIEMNNNGNKVYISIFNKKAIMDIFDKDDTKKLEYLEELEDESLKKEGFMNVMRGKKGITLNIKRKSAEEIFFMIKKELRGEKNE